MHCLTKLSLRQCGVALVVAWLVAASSACSAAERETLLLEDHFQGRVSPEWTTVGHGGPQKLDPAQAALGRDPGGRHFLEIHSGLSIGKNASHWKDYRLTLSFRLPEPAADGNQLLRIIVRGPAANIWGGYNIYLYNVGGKFKIQANVWPTNPSVITPVAVNLRWHELSVSVLGQELQAQLDGRGDAKVATTDIYDASTAGGIYLGFSPGKWQLADVRVVALRPILEATDLLAQYCRLAYHPSLGKLAVKADFGECSEQPWVRRVTAVRFTVQPAGKDDALAKAEILLDAKKAGAAEVSLPKLPEGRYELKLTAFGASLEATKQFVRRTFPWERNSLGITDQVYPPFEPLAVSGNEVRVVGRLYSMNELGLWDRVQSQGHDLLAAPITLRCETASGRAPWKSPGGRFRQTGGSAAVFVASAESQAVSVRTTSTIEFDGCMKVEMDLTPVAGGPAVRRLWLEVPLADKEVPLFFPQLSGCRENYAGPTPRGGKIVWQPRATEWMNFPARTWKAEAGPEDGVIWTPRTCYDRDFAYYIWLGGAERGLAWFAENDRGYVVDPRGDAETVSREGGKVVLRVYLVNREALDGPRHVVFGLQASPTKPLPKDWRRNVAVPIHSGPCMGVGGYMCADKYPADYDFTVVNRVLDARRTGAVDEAFFRAKDKTRSHQPALTHGRDPWLDATLGEARIAQMYTRPDWIEESGRHAAGGRSQEGAGGALSVVFRGALRQCRYARVGGLPGRMGAERVHLAAVAEDGYLHVPHGGKHDDALRERQRGHHAKLRRFRALVRQRVAQTRREPVPGQLDAPAMLRPAQVGRVPPAGRRGRACGAALVAARVLQADVELALSMEPARRRLSADHHASRHQHADAALAYLGQQAERPGVGAEIPADGAGLPAHGDGFPPNRQLLRPDRALDARPGEVCGVQGGADGAGIAGPHGMGHADGPRDRALGLPLRERGQRRTGPPLGKSRLGLRLRSAPLPRPELLERGRGVRGSSRPALAGAGLRKRPAAHAGASELPGQASAGQTSLRRPAAGLRALGHDHRRGDRQELGPSGVHCHGLHGPTLRHARHCLRRGIDGRDGIDQLLATGRLLASGRALLANRLVHQG